MMDPMQRRASCRCQIRPVFWVFWAFLLFLCGAVEEVSAFSSTLKYDTEDQGRREILSFRLPPGSARPTAELVGMKMLRVTVPGILALPANNLDTERSRWISSFNVEDIPSGALGINLLIGLKKPNLSFRDSLGDADPVLGTKYRLEIDQRIHPVDAKETKILEGRILAGRDGTLVVLSRTGSDSVETAVEMSARVVRLHWQNATLDPGWRSIKPEGLAERLLAYDFSVKQVEMELLFHDSVQEVKFHQDPAAGLFIIELIRRDDMGREADARAIIQERKESLAAGESPPLNRMDLIFDPRPSVTLTLQDRPVGESYFMKGAQDSARDRKYALARSYLDKLLELFPDTPNRQLIDLYKWDLANSMGWKPGWLLSELNTLMANYPNMMRYPRYRLAQLHFLNQSARYEDAAAILWDPNLPKGDPSVWLERGYTAMGLARSGAPGADLHWQEAEKYLRQVVALSQGKRDIDAEAHFLLARMAQELRKTGKDGAIPLLDGLSPKQISTIANRPEWLMAVADIYYENRLYSQSFKYYSQFLSNYPNISEIVPWAVLRAAESSRLLGMDRDARRLFESLQKNYPESDSAAWGRVFQLRLDKTTDVTERLESLDAVIKTIALPDVLSETLRTKAEMQGGAKRYQDALRTLNNLLSLTSREKVVTHANKLKRAYLIAGMYQALNNDRPEHAILLAEQHGDDWRNRPEFAPAQVALAEALLRLGLRRESLALLKGVSAPAVPGLTKLAIAFSEGRWPEVSLSLDSAQFSPSFAKGAQAGEYTEDALAALQEGVPSVDDGIPPLNNDLFSLGMDGLVDGEESTTAGGVTAAEARVRLDEAMRLVADKEWYGILDLLEQLPSGLLNQESQAKRLRLMAKAEAGRGRFPHAVRHLENLVSGRPLKDGADYYWYATLLQRWKGDLKSLPAFQRTSAEAEDTEVQSLAHIRIGDIMQRSGDFNEAMKQYKEAARLVPGTPWAKVSEENAAQLAMAMEAAK